MAKKEKKTKRNLVFLIEVGTIIAFFFTLLSGGFNDVGTQIKNYFSRMGISNTQNIKPSQSSSTDNLEEKDATILQLLTYQNKKQLVMLPLDQYGRATLSHIQLKASDQPTDQREPRINYDPSGWHNYKFETSAGKKAWLNNLTHLIGYQFSGLNDQAENLVTATSYLNKGTVETGMDDSNPNGMLYYENRLAKWLKKNPDCYLDYAVKAKYHDDDLVPYAIYMQYAGFDSSGKEIKIKLGGRETYVSNVTKVTLNNTSPNATIDYTTGSATQK